MAGKFSRQADQFTLYIGELFNRSMRKALRNGLETAVRETKHDSSNAGYHWLLAAKQSRPASRKEGQLKDLRETKDRPRTPPVGKRRAGGAHKEETVTFVLNRETEKTLGKYLAGRRPAALWSFYTSVGTNEIYAENAQVEAAGTAAVAKVVEVMEAEIKKGNARKRPL